MHYQAHGRRLDCLECVLGPDLEHQAIVRAPLPDGRTITIVRDNPRNHTYCISVGRRGGPEPMRWVHRQGDVLPALRELVPALPAPDRWTCGWLGVDTTWGCLEARRQQGWGTGA